MEKTNYSQQTMVKENGIEYSSKEDRVKEKVVYKVVPVPYYYPVPVDAEWYYKHYEPPMRNGTDRGYHGYEDPTIDHFPFPPPPLQGFPAPPRSRDFHYYPAGGREDMERYYRPVSPSYRNMSSGRGEFSPPAPNRESSKKQKQPKENGDSHQSGSENGENMEKKDKLPKSNNKNIPEKEKSNKSDEGEEPVYEARSVKSEENNSEMADDDNNDVSINNGGKKDGSEEETTPSANNKNNESESNRKRKRYMMTFPYDQRKKTKDTPGEELDTKEDKNNNNNNTHNGNSLDSVEDLSTNEHTPEHRRIRGDNNSSSSDERERTYLKQKAYSTNGGTNGHYPPYMVMRSPSYMGGSESGRSGRYPHPHSHERSHSMYEARGHYEESYKDHESAVHLDELDDDKKEIRYHPNGRRARTVFTRQQLLTLNNVFDKHPFVSGERMSELSDQLGLDRKIVKIWFQNKRQYARKKGSLVERNEEFYYDYQDRYNPSSAPPTMAAERWENGN